MNKQTIFFALKTLVLNTALFSSLGFSQTRAVPDYAWREPFAYSLESEHPYRNNMDTSWTIQSSGARYLRINFSVIDLEGSYDHLYVYDAAGRQVAAFSGAYPEGAVVEVTGESARIRMTTDSSVVRHGFEIFSYQVSHWPH